MDDLLKRNLAEDTIRQKEIAKQMAKQMVMQKQQTNVQVVSADDKTRSDTASKTQKLDSMLSDRDASKSEFDRYVAKMDGVMTTGISEILTGKDRIVTDAMLHNINMEDVIPVLAERPDILDASQDMAAALTDNDSNVNKFYDKIRDKVQQYNEEKLITGEDHYEDQAADFSFEDDQEAKDSDGTEYLDDKPPYDLNAFVNFKDTFVDYFNHKKHSSLDDLKRSLHEHMSALVQDQYDQVQSSPMLGSVADTGVDSGGHPKIYQGINDKLYGSDSDFQEDQNSQLMFLQRLCPKGMMGAIMLAFFVAQQAMQENMKGPASDVYSTSASVSRLSQFSSLMKRVENKDDDGGKITVYIKQEDGTWKEEPNPTPEQYAKWLLLNANKAVNVGTADKPKYGCGTTSNATQNLINFIKQGAHIFGANLDNRFSNIPSELKKLNPDDIDDDATEIATAYKELMGTKSNGDPAGSNGEGIVATWMRKNDPNNSSAILQILNGDQSYRLYRDGGENAFQQYNSAKDGLAANLSTSTAALNLGQSQQNANNTAFYGWMKSWEDNAIEIARKTG